MENLVNHVTAATTIPERYRHHAAWQSMDAYLQDWVAARDRLDRQILALRQLLTDRRRATEAGEWPDAEGQP